MPPVAILILHASFIVQHTVRAMEGLPKSEGYPTDFVSTGKMTLLPVRCEKLHG